MTNENPMHAANVPVRINTSSPSAPEFLTAIDKLNTLQCRGRVVHAYGTSIRVTGIAAHIGQQCLIGDRNSKVQIRADVVGLSNGEAILLPLDSLDGITLQSDVRLIDHAVSVPFGPQLLGRVVNAIGDFIDAGSPARPTNNMSRPAENQVDEAKALVRQPLHASPPNPLLRSPIARIFCTGIAAIDSFLTTGAGQRMGIFAKAGAGKSTLLGMLVKAASADVVIVALIGERGREVKEFIDQHLGKEGMQRSILIVATAERPAMERVRAAYTATAIAEGFRAQGKQVLLLMDSVTRYARALREIGLSVGESAVRRGYPASVFPELPKLFERAGNDQHGSITAFYAILVEDDNDPIAEEVRSILDGHIVLSRQLAEAGQYPAIDIQASVSRLFGALASTAHKSAAVHLRRLMAKYQEIELLIQIGEYQQGADTLADEAIAKYQKIQNFLSQSLDESIQIDRTLEKLIELANAQQRSS